MQEPASADEERQLDAVSVVQVGVSLIGVYVLSEAFPKATQAVMLMVFQNQTGDIPDLRPSLVASWVSLGVQLFLGVCLMFGGGSLARLIGWARVAGVAKGPNDGGRGLVLRPPPAATTLRPSPENAPTPAVAAVPGHRNPLSVDAQGTAL